MYGAKGIVLSIEGKSLKTPGLLETIKEDFKTSEGKLQVLCCKWREHT